MTLSREIQNLIVASALEDRSVAHLVSAYLEARDFEDGKTPITYRHERAETVLRREYVAAFLIMGMSEDEALGCYDWPAALCECKGIPVLILKAIGTAIGAREANEARELYAYAQARLVQS